MINYTHYLLMALFICHAPYILSMSDKEAPQFTQEQLELLPEKLEAQVREFNLPEKDASTCRQAINMHAIALLFRETATSLHVPDRFSKKTVEQLIAMHTALGKSLEERQDIFAQDATVKKRLDETFILAQQEHTELKLAKLLRKHNKHAPFSFTKYVSDACTIL